MAHCVRGAVAWPPLLVKVNPDLTLDPGNNNRGIDHAEGVPVARGTFWKFQPEGDTLHLAFAVSAPGDAACCPSGVEDGNYVIRNGQFAKVDDATGELYDAASNPKQRCFTRKYLNTLPAPPSFIDLPICKPSEVGADY